MLNPILQRELYSKLPSQKIKIAQNRNPIPMDLFLSFLTVNVFRSSRHPGSDMGWTMLYSQFIGLEIGGGIVGGMEYLDKIQFGNRLDNPYNNFVNPFYLSEIMTNGGHAFFLDYYKEDINKVLMGMSDKIRDAQNTLDALVNSQSTVLSEVSRLMNMGKGVENGI